MDLIDRKILNLLEADATLPVKEIAKKVRQSRETTAYRIKRLKENNVIENFGAVINRDFFGYEDVYVLIKTKDCSKEKAREITEYLISNPQTKWINELLGEFNFYCVITVKKLKEIISFVHEVKNNFLGHISEVQILPIHSFVDWKPHVVIKEKKGELLEREIKINPIKLTELDIKILVELAKDVRQTNVELSKKLGVTQKTIIDHKKKYKKNGIFIGTFCRINIEALNLENFKVFIKLKDVTKNTLSKLKETIRQYNEIIYADTIMGEWQCRMDITVRNSRHLHEVMLGFQEKMGQSVESLIILQTISELKRTSFPKCMQKL